MPMHNPPHPGPGIRWTCLEPLGLTVTAAAEALGVGRVALSMVLNGRAGISPDMAIRLERVFGGTARHWLAIQSAYDLWQAQQREQPKLKRLAR